VGRRLALGFLVVSLTAIGAPQRETVRGHLAQDPLKPPALITREGKTVALEGDEPTVAVLRDLRLKDEEFEAVGEFTGQGRFRIDPIHERALFIYRGGKRLVITYWCEVCGIRTYSPGRCVCCQQETAFDPRDPALANVQ